MDHKKQKVITIVGTSYVEQIVPDLVEKCFDAYKIRDLKRRMFQVSPHENAYATAAILLTDIAIESYVNRVKYLRKEQKRGNSYSYISKVLGKINKKFPETVFEEMLLEVFILRDVIAHNHVYSINVGFDSAWNMTSHRQKLQTGYGDQKYKLAVNLRTRKTRLLGLNVQPSKISFHDLFIVLSVFDLFTSVASSILVGNYVYFHFTHKILGDWVDYPVFLSHYYNLIPNPKGRDELRVKLDLLRTKFESSISTEKLSFFQNRCYKCGEYGFRQPNDINRCLRCGAEVRLAGKYIKVSQ